MAWVREGECPPEVCQGRCCTHVGIWFPDPGPQVKDFLKVQQIRGLSVKGKDGDYLLDFPQTCQYLTREGLCSLHPSMKSSADLPVRPDFCEDWPSEPSQLINDPYCGFTFRWVDEPLGVQG